MIRAPKDSVMYDGVHEFKDQRRKVVLHEWNIESYKATLDLEAQKRLSSTLGRARLGFGTDLVTPYIGKSEPDKDAVRALIRDEILNQVIPSGYKTLDAAERAQWEKVGSLSIMAPFSQRREGLMAYWSSPNRMVKWIYDPIMMHQAYENIKRQLVPAHKLKATSIDVGFDNMPRGTSLGAPFFSKQEKYYPELVALARSIEKEGFDANKFLLPAILFWRGQSRGIGETPKQRAVWGYPHSITIHELRVQVPFVEHLKRLPSFCALVSPEATDRQMTYILDHKPKGSILRYIFSIDFGSFDQFAPPVLIKYAFDLLRDCFERRDHRLISYIEEQFTSIPLLHPDGVWYGSHGVPSGSGMTNQIDSIIQWLFWEYFSLWYGSKLGPSAFQGDDGVISFVHGTNLKKKRRFFDPTVRDIQRVGNWLGMSVTVDKGGVSRDVIYFCQNLHMSQYRIGGRAVGVRPIERSLSGLLGFETARDKNWLPAHTTLRSLQQVEQCKYHPRFEVLVRWLLSKDRLLQQYSIQAIIAMAGGMSEAEAALKEKAGLFNKPSIKGVYKYHCVQLIKRIKENGKGAVE